MLSWLRKSTTAGIPIEDQLAQLTRHGVTLATGVTLADVARLPERATLVGAGYRATLCALGAERRDGQGRPLFLSNDVWFFDSACIQGPGDYAHVVARLAAMLPQEFAARDIADSVAIEEWRASVSFQIGETRLHWTQRVMDTWIDETILLRINQMIADPDQARHLWQVPLDGQHRLIVAATTADARRLAQNCRLALRNIV